MSHSGAIAPIGGRSLLWAERPVRPAALVADDDLHAGRLADDAQRRLDREPGETIDQAAHAEAADLLVERDGEMQRRLERPPHHLRHEAERDTDEALHVGGAAAENPAALLPHGKGIALPVLAVDRH